MASPSKQSFPEGTGLLHGNRTRSYGSLVKSLSSRRVEHLLEPEDTLQGLALKYGVTMEQIKRANRLYTNDSIFLKKTLYIPIPQVLSNGLNLEEEEREASRPEREEARNRARKAAEGNPTSQRDLSAADFLRKLDSEIQQSKQAAAMKLQEGESAIVVEPPRSSRTASPQSEARQRSQLGPAPLTKASRTSTLKDREDEIFDL
uniref:LysM and putative peptidoglycan-binding domain-containing protein 1 n=1 Tax=Sphenodon punctatus TaxID=8508 RepID=A0A8D0L0P1_SPHPU